MALKVGRNEPCPCGSGKKYKKCCMQKQESIEKAEQSLRGDIFSFSGEQRFKDDLKDAMDIFFEGREPDDGGKSMFIDWFIHDYSLKDYGKSIIELFYFGKLPHLSPLEKQIIEGWQNTVIGVYEVTGIERGKGVYVKDIFDNNENFVNDICSSRGMEKWDVVTLRIITAGDKYYLSGGTYILPPSAKADIIRYGEEEFLKFKKEEPGATWREFMKSFGYKFITFAYKKATQLPKIITPEGDPIVFATAVYKVKDYERAVDALQSITVFRILDSSPEEIHFGWHVEITEPKVSEGRLVTQTTFTTEEEGTQYRSMGDLTINKNKLTLSCLSEKRLETGKNLLKTLGDAIELRSESKEYLDLKDIKHKTQKTIGNDPVLEEHKVRFLEDYYRKWLDMPIPFLDNMTPKEASKTQEGKAKLKELLKVLENAEGRKKRAEQPSYDVSKLRETLGV